MAVAVGAWVEKPAGSAVGPPAMAIEVAAEVARKNTARRQRAVLGPRLRLILVISLGKVGIESMVQID